MSNKTQQSNSTNISVYECDCNGLLAAVNISNFYELLCMSSTKKLRKQNWKTFREEAHKDQGRIGKCTMYVSLFVVIDTI